MADPKPAEETSANTVELQKARVREAILSATEERPAGISSRRFKDHSVRSLKSDIQRRYSEKMMASLFSAPGFDSERLEKVRAGGQAEMSEAVRQHKEMVVRRSAATAEHLRSEWEARRRRQELLAAHAADSPNLNLNFVVLDTPALILPSQDVALVKAAPAPWNNVAKINAGWSSPYPDDGTDTLSYVFAWRNPSDRYALINVASYLGLNGFCDAGAGPGFNHADLLITTRLGIFEWWNNPATQPPYQSGQINFSLPFLEAYGGGGFGVGDFETMAVTGNYDVEYRMFSVPPHEVAVFTVALGLGHFIIGDGYLDVDFASGDLQIMCPALVIAIVS